MQSNTIKNIPVEELELIWNLIDEAKYLDIEIKEKSLRLNQIKAQLRNLEPQEIYTYKSICTISQSEVVKIIKDSDEILNVMGKNFDLAFSLEAVLKNSKVLRILAETRKEIKDLFVIEEQKRIAFK